jgi:hypothetical protein
MKEKKRVNRIIIENNPQMGGEPRSKKKVTRQSYPCKRPRRPIEL